MKTPVIVLKTIQLSPHNRQLHPQITVKTLTMSQSSNQQDGQRAKSIRSTQSLLDHNLIEQADFEAIQQVSQGFAVGITHHVYQHIAQQSEADPIYQQFVPQAQELNIQAQELGDPIGDERFTPVTGIVHRHGDRCLFKPVNVCPVYCRFCFRRETIGQGSLTPEQTQKALDYIASQPQIWEVILTGGDPMVMKPKQMHELITQLSAINHVQVIRLHTRVPVTDPARINMAMLEALQQHIPVYLVVHANHPREFTAQARAACERLINAGVVLLSQTVLLRGINDNAEVLQNLMRQFVVNRIKPYYLHHGDMAKGTSHFRTSIQAGQALMSALRRDLSGLCLPTYVLDVPGGYGKVPIGPHYVAPCRATCGSDEMDHYWVSDHEGQWHHYTDQ